MKKSGIVHCKTAPLSDYQGHHRRRRDRDCTREGYEYIKSTGEGYEYIKVIKTRPRRICHAYWIQDIQISERCLAAEAVERLLTYADV